jgi:5-methylcytosine-specific restriction endonuclease McrA
MFDSIKRVFSRKKSKNDLLKEIEELKKLIRSDASKTERTERKSTEKVCRYISEYIKVEVRKKQNNKCAICGNRFFEDLINYDHKIPVALGGTSDVSNIQALCPTCHYLKTRHDRYLTSIMDELKGVTRELVLKNVKRGWFFVGTFSKSTENESIGNVPSWIIDNIENAEFRFNKSDKVMYSIQKGTNYTYLIVQYGRGKFIVFKRLNKKSKLSKRLKRRHR